MSSANLRQLVAPLAVGIAHLLCALHGFAPGLQTAAGCSGRGL